MLTTFELDEYVFEALRAGAAGFLIKDSEPADLLRAIRLVGGGGVAAVAVGDPAGDRLVRRPGAARPRRHTRGSATLTEREREVLALVGEGLNNDEIAGRLVVSPATARTHVSRAMTKLGARDRAQLVVIAYQSGLVSYVGDPRTGMRAQRRGVRSCRPTQPARRITMTDSEMLPSRAKPAAAPEADARPVPPLWGIVVLAALVLAGVGLHSVASIVAPVFLVITLVITVAPFRRTLVKRGLPSWLASTIALITIYLMLVIILGAVVWSLARMVTALPEYAAQFDKLLTSALGQLAQIGISEGQIRNTASSLDLSSFTGVASALLSGITGGVSLLALMLAIAIFLAFDAGTIGDRLALIRESRPQTAAGFSDFAVSGPQVLGRHHHLRLIVAVIDVIGLLIIGVPLALTWGVLAFVTNYIPNIGFIIGLIPPAVIALLDGGVGPRPGRARSSTSR